MFNRVGYWCQKQALYGVGRGAFKSVGGYSSIVRRRSSLSLVGSCLTGIVMIRLEVGLL